MDTGTQKTEVGGEQEVWGQDMREDTGPGCRGTQTDRSGETEPNKEHISQVIKATQLAKDVHIVKNNDTNLQK